MGATMSTEWRAQIISGAALTAAAAAVWWLTSSSGAAAIAACMQQQHNGSASRKGRRRVVPLSQALTEQIMKEIAEAFFCVFTELAQVACNVAQAVHTHPFHPGDAPTQEQVEAMLMEQVFQERLCTAEAEVLKRHGDVCKEALETACDKYRHTNTKIALYYTGIKEMYAAAVSGELPLLPGAELPPDVSEEMVLSALQQVHAVKQEKFLHLLVDAQPSDFKTPGPAMAKKLQKCNKEAEQQVLSMPQYAPLTEALLLHAVALYSRDSSFKIKKQLLDELHSEHVMAMMEKRKNELQARGVYTPENDCVVAALHPKLEEVTAAELVSRLQSSGDGGVAGRGGHTIAVLVLRGNGGSSPRVGEGESAVNGGVNDVAAAAAAAATAGVGMSTDHLSGLGITHKTRRGKVAEEDIMGKKNIRERSPNRAGVPYLRALNDFCEAIESIDYEDLSFLYLEHQEAQQVPIAAVRTAAADARNVGAAYLLFKGPEALIRTTLLDEFVEAADTAKRGWLASVAANTAKSSSATAAVTSAAASVPPGCPVRCNDGSPTAFSPTAIHTFAAECLPTGAADDISDEGTAAAFVAVTNVLNCVDTATDKAAVAASSPAHIQAHASQTKEAAATITHNAVAGDSPTCTLLPPSAAASTPAAATGDASSAP